jgi:hypothetical protein
VETVLRTLLLSIRQASTGGWILALILPLWIVAAALAVAFGFAATGMWRLKDWGRKLFLGLSSAYYGSLLVGGLPVWGPLVGLSLRSPGQNWVTTVVVEATLGLGFVWWYLNRDKVKRWFNVTGLAKDERTARVGTR